MGEPADSIRVIDGKSEAELASSIRDATECYFEIPFSDVGISIVYA